MDIQREVEQENNMRRIKALQSHITSILAAVLTKDKHCLGHEPAATVGDGVPNLGAGPLSSRFHRYG